MVIRILSQNMSKQIASGEMIHDLFSIVKELIENRNGYYINQKTITC